MPNETPRSTPASPPATILTRTPPLETIDHTPKRHPTAFDPSDPATGEPYFTLLGRDPAAPLFIRAWAYWRMGQPAMAQIEIAKVTAIYSNGDPQNQSGDLQIQSAFRIADEMERFQRVKTLSGRS